MKGTSRQPIQSHKLIAQQIKHGQTSLGQTTPNGFRGFPVFPNDLDALLAHLSVRDFLHFSQSIFRPCLPSVTPCSTSSRETIPIVRHGGMLSSSDVLNKISEG